MSVLQAQETFTLTSPDGAVVSVSAGQTADEGAWVAKKNPGAFAPLAVDFPAEKKVRASTRKPDEEPGVEQATARPGEKRRKTSG